MRLDKTLPGSSSISLGSETVPFTMDAEIGHMTLDEAIASGLFDLPDEPGMVSIPVTMQVAIPGHLLQPPSSPPLPAERHGSSAVPTGGRRPRTRFGNYPKAIAARNIARTLQDMLGPSRAAEDASFREMLKAIRPMRTQTAPTPELEPPSLPHAPSIDTNSVALPRIVADTAPPATGPGNPPDAASMRHDSTSLHAPAPVGGADADKPGPVASWLRSEFGDVDPDHWASVSAAADGTPIRAAVFRTRSFAEPGSAGTAESMKQSIVYSDTPQSKTVFHTTDKTETFRSDR